MSDLTAAQWRDVEKAAVEFHNLYTELGINIPVKVIPVGDLRKIVRKSRRSLDQNSLIHALFDDAIKAGGEALGGWTAEDIKEWALGEYWGWDRLEALGRTKLRPKRRSSSMTKIECADFTEWFVAQMAEHGIVLDTGKAHDE